MNNILFGLKRLIIADGLKKRAGKFGTRRRPDV